MAHLLPATFRGRHEARPPSAAARGCDAEVTTTKDRFGQFAVTVGFENAHPVLAIRGEVDRVNAPELGAIAPCFGLPLRSLQTQVEISVEKNATIVFPGLVKSRKCAASSSGPGRRLEDRAVLDI